MGGGEQAVGGEVWPDRYVQRVCRGKWDMGGDWAGPKYLGRLPQKDGAEGSPQAIAAVK